VSLIQRFYLYADVSTKQMHYAWQAGVRRSSVSFSIKLAAFQASGGAHMKLHSIRQDLQDYQDFLGLVRQYLVHPACRGEAF
jgi:hypothetical protein